MKLLIICLVLTCGYDHLIGFNLTMCPRHLTPKSQGSNHWAALPALGWEKRVGRPEVKIMMKLICYWRQITSDRKKKAYVRSGEATWLTVAKQWGQVRLCICHQIAEGDLLSESHTLQLDWHDTAVIMTDASERMHQLNGPGDGSHSPFPVKAVQALGMLPRRPASLCGRESWAPIRVLHDR